MRFIQYLEKGILKLAVGLDTNFFSIDLLNEIGQGNYPNSLKNFIENDYDYAELQELIEQALFEEEKPLTLSQVDFAPVIINPEKILCIGLNYLSHINETPESNTPLEPIVFGKFNNALAGHNQSISLPDKGKEFDYEVELVIVIGKDVKNISAETAQEYIFGYTIGNDLSVRDLQFKSSQWLLGKSPDLFAPIGPHLVTEDELNSENLIIQLKRNGVLVQSSNTKNMIFSINEIIAYLSQHMTLKAGDLIFTGTPAGVILGQEESKRVWLKNGDILEASIEGIGTLTNKII